jgi:hypothetical protein
LPTTSVVERYVLIAVDLSGPIVDSEYLSTLHAAVGNLVERVGKDAHLSVQAFDGDGLKPFVNFEDADQKAGLSGLRRFRPHNRTVDLWGSYLAALDALDEAAGHATAPEHTAQLLFVTDRRDKAGKHTPSIRPSCGNWAGRRRSSPTSSRTCESRWSRRRTGSRPRTTRT